MTEAQVGFLFKLASAIRQNTQNNYTHTMLRSYYLMRCNDLTRGYGLPNKHFSVKARCPDCCLDWTVKTETKVVPINLSKRQRKRIRSLKKNSRNKNRIQMKKTLLHSNQLVQVCDFCNHRTSTNLVKLERTSNSNDQRLISQKPTEKLKNEVVKTKQESVTKPSKKPANTNVYSNAFDVFSIKNTNNKLPSTLKEQPKVIKNNKKKKDKFAGLCQAAVLASAKMKQEKNKNNKLNLFLKPSTSL